MKFKSAKNGDAKDIINTIIFASDELDPFDKENQLHKQIFEMRFLYCPIKKQKVNEKKCIIEHLFGINIKNKKGLQKFFDKHEIYIFALKKDENGRGDESTNSDIVFDDIKLTSDFIKDLFSNDSEGKTLEDFLNLKLINYYVLSNNNINFTFYSERLEEVTKKLLKKEGKQIRKNSPKLFNLKVLNEAIMSGDNLIDVEIKNSNSASFLNDKLEAGCLNSNSIESSKIENCDVKNLVIGFGEVGQAALGSLILLENGGELDDYLVLKPSSFKALVIDENFSKEKNENNIIEDYKINHPLFAFSKYPFDENNDDEYYSAYKKIIHAYFDSDNEYEIIRKYRKKMNSEFAKINEYISFPLILYSSIAYGSVSFSEKILNKIIDGEFKKIVISLGNDEDNIKCANYILKAIHQSEKYMNGLFKSSIRFYINLKDSNNNDRINTNPLDTSYNILVNIFGNLKDIYSPTIINCEKEAEIYDHYKKEKAKDCLNDKQYQYLTENTILNKKINETSSKFIEFYIKYIEEMKCSEKMLKRYKDYLEVLKDQKMRSKDKKIRLKGLKKYEYKKGIIKNIEFVYGRWMAYFNFSNFIRLNSESFLEKDSVKDIKFINDEGKTWRYLIQVHNLIRQKLRMIYGYTYIDDFNKIDVPNNIENSDSNKDSNNSFHKDYLKYYRRLLPFDEYTSFLNKNELIQNFNNNHKRLFYKKEDASYATIITAVAEAEKKKELTKDKFETKMSYIKIEAKNDKDKEEFYGRHIVFNAFAFSMIPPYKFKKTDFSFGKEVKIKMSKDIKTIGKSAFQDCKNLLSVIFPENLLAIEEDAFNGCDNMCNIRLKSKIRVIGRNAFANMENITKIDVYNKFYEAKNNTIIEKNTNSIICGSNISNHGKKDVFEGVLRICEGAFSGRRISTFKFPNSLIEIEDKAFYNCCLLKSVIIPKNVEKIGRNVFTKTPKINSIKVEAENKHFDSRDECNGIINTKDNKLLYGCSKTIIPDSVTEIGENAFQECTTLKEIDIKNVEIICENAFLGCTLLEKICMNNNKLKIISKNAFKSCSAIETIELPDSVKNIERGAFSNCKSLKSINIPSGLKNIGFDLLKGCNSLKFIYIPKDSKIFAINYDILEYFNKKTLTIRYYGTKDNWKNLKTKNRKLIDSWEKKFNIEFML